MSNRGGDANWVPIAAGVVVSAGILALIYKMFFASSGIGRDSVYVKFNQQPNAPYKCTCDKRNKVPEGYHNWTHTQPDRVSNTQKYIHLSRTQKQYSAQQDDNSESKKEEKKKPNRESDSFDPSSPVVPLEDHRGWLDFLSYPFGGSLSTADTVILTEDSAIGSTDFAAKPGSSKSFKPASHATDTAYVAPPPDFTTFDPFASEIRSEDHRGWFDSKSFPFGVSTSTTDNTVRDSDTFDPFSPVVPSEDRRGWLDYIPYPFGGSTSTADTSTLTEGSAIGSTAFAATSGSSQSFRPATQASDTAHVAAPPDFTTFDPFASEIRSEDHRGWFDSKSFPFGVSTSTTDNTVRDSDTFDPFSPVVPSEDRRGWLDYIPYPFGGSTSTADTSTLTEGSAIGSTAFAATSGSSQSFRPATQASDTAHVAAPPDFTTFDPFASEVRLEDHSGWFGTSTKKNTERDSDTFDPFSPVVSSEDRRGWLDIIPYPFGGSNSSADNSLNTGGGGPAYIAASGARKTSDHAGVTLDKANNYVGSTDKATVKAPIGSRGGSALHTATGGGNTASGTKTDSSTAGVGTAQTSADKHTGDNQAFTSDWSRVLPYIAGSLFFICIIQLIYRNHNKITEKLSEVIEKLSSFKELFNMKTFGTIGSFSLGGFSSLTNFGNIGSWKDIGTRPFKSVTSIGKSIGKVGSWSWTGPGSESSSTTRTWGRGQTESTGTTGGTTGDSSKTLWGWGGFRSKGGTNTEDSGTSKGASTWGRGRGGATATGSGSTTTGDSGISSSAKTWNYSGTSATETSGTVTTEDDGTSSKTTAWGWGRLSNSAQRDSEKISTEDSGKSSGTIGPSGNSDTEASGTTSSENDTNTWGLSGMGSKSASISENKETSDTTTTGSKTITGNASVSRTVESTGLLGGIDSTNVTEKLADTARIESAGTTGWASSMGSARDTHKTRVTRETEGTRWTASTQKTEQTAPTDKILGDRDTWWAGIADGKGVIVTGKSRGSNRAEDTGPTSVTRKAAAEKTDGSTMLVVTQRLDATAGLNEAKQEDATETLKGDDVTERSVGTGQLGETRSPDVTKQKNSTGLMDKAVRPSETGQPSDTVKSGRTRRPDITGRLDSTGTKRKTDKPDGTPWKHLSKSEIGKQKGTGWRDSTIRSDEVDRKDKTERSGGARRTDSTKISVGTKGNEEPGRQSGAEWKDAFKKNREAEWKDRIGKPGATEWKDRTGRSDRLDWKHQIGKPDDDELKDRTGRPGGVKWKDAFEGKDRTKRLSEAEWKDKSGRPSGAESKHNPGRPGGAEWKYRTGRSGGTEWKDENERPGGNEWKDRTASPGGMDTEWTKIRSIGVCREVTVRSAVTERAKTVVPDGSSLKKGERIDISSSEDRGNAQSSGVSEGNERSSKRVCPGNKNLERPHILECKRKWSISEIDRTQ